MPSARAVLRLTVSVNLVGWSMGSAPGLAPLRILSTYSAERLVFVARPIGHEPAVLDVRPLPRDDGQPRLRGQVEKRRSMSKGRGASITYSACACARLTASKAGPISSDVRTLTKVSSIASEGAVALRFSSALAWYGGWIPQDNDAGKLRHRLLEQLQSLGAELRQHDRESRDVAARLREIGDEAGSDRIGDDGHHDRDRGRRARGGLGGGCRVGDDHLDLALHEIGGQLRKLSVVAVDRSPLDHHIASLHVASVAQPLPKGLGLFARE
jgi:hypothetical protein